MLLFEEGRDYIIEHDDQLPYRHIRNLGSGHSGIVEKVEDRLTGSVFARKIIRFPSPRKKDETRKIFENEIKIIRSLTGHRHVIHVYATYVAECELGLILQPVADNKDLEHFLGLCWSRLQGRNPIAAVSEGDATQTMSEVLKRAFGCLASGLTYMHKHKIRHKDIKPRNILIHQGSVIYTDFGYSLDFSQWGHSTTSGTPGFLTRRYSAPEVLDHDARNSRSDVYSLGCVYMEILSFLVQNPEIDTKTTFSDDIDRLHGLLSEKFPAEMSFVAKATIDMTQRDRSLRPTASQITSIFFSHPRFTCSSCQGDLVDVQQQAHPPANPLSSTVNSHSTLGEDSNLSQRNLEIAPLSTLASDMYKNSGWIWSYEYQDYYRITYDDKQQPSYHWYKVLHPSNPSQEGYACSSYGDASNLKKTPHGLPIRSLSRETTAGGSDETMDHNYRVLPELEAHEFWRTGRVFSMIWTEAPIKPVLGGGSENSPLRTRYSQKTDYTHIRHFIVVSAKRRSRVVKACRISTYSRRGTLDASCDSWEHAVVYLSGKDPLWLNGEYEKGLRKDPIRIEPAHSSVSLHPTSRVRLGTTWPIDWNVEVRNIGMVAQEDRPKLLEYWKKEEMELDD